MAAQDRGVRAAMRQTCTGPNGQWSAMRVASLLVTAVVLLMWVGFCLYEGRLIPLTWQDVAIIGGAQGAKALQSRFEWAGAASGAVAAWATRGMERDCDD